ncbi:MAG: tripartite tricarboxylate transporter TctB family protein [Burkholderiales bacterium]|nr:tripartite tricarboxylate transporter TctB family protein [Burkholderiales bacterium]MDE1929748.1 tripartite tricarboxylate transporter TctB family protein [Burkholderiales bacterium]MDE2160310.1 tripartite tricarboxylate transporter TctB family protein [Burkholderiales bacterium]MDE2503329.1 tripartite tricarboxylate transporter TctB family protein [Burkholderiales bacterium]
MRKLNRLGKDHWGALLLLALGVFVIWLGVGYRIGTLHRMGPGFVPVVIGVLMIGVGLAIGITATPDTRVPRPITTGLPRPSQEGPQWRGWLCILAGVFAFVILGQWGGFVPATFASVFIAALGDRQNTLKSATLLALAMVAMAVIVFHYGLQLQLDLFAWP